ncbi:hexosaminidase [Saccharicrinis carchari]|uniref:beta-N-acetylhexosaminidase n=1 Tax=Saccharicrinis carchari TaxID=1168039 RepID=A0A521EC36_SACCC|nr:family 20 glycosylhydrolase [Saccharicrinis carchari]SMO81352.1 hexosaminidase [Saccharicrinis carchari]
MKKRTLFCVLLLSIVLLPVDAKSIDVIPRPVKMTENGQMFNLARGTSILYSPGLKQQAELLLSALSPAAGWDLQVSEAGKVKSNVIFLKLDKTGDIKSEGYKLSVTGKNIVITAVDGAGAFYGVQTLLQLLPVEIFNKQRQKNVTWNVPGVEISDAPSYPWRGMMLDVSRYFFEKDYVLRFIDMMAMYKLNVLHFHLIDDAGWRLEIKKYPKLTSVGAWRGEGKDRIGGYYTQEDIRDIVAYASARNVEVIPEIELPAHVLSAIAAYPHLSCTGKQHEVPTQHFISRDLYCAGKESTYEFLQDVFDEAVTLFPSKYVHIGGDEAVYDRWKVCEHCQKRKQELGLETEKELRVYMNKRIQKMLAGHGKIVVGWDEIIEEGLTDKAVGMIWHDKSKAMAGTAAGHDVVMALTGHTYFDFPESAIPGEVQAATWLPPISLKQAYEWDPMIAGLEPRFRDQVLGVNGCLWSDQFIHGPKLPRINAINENRAEKYMDYLTFPRMAALAEVGWTPQELRSWEEFEDNMRTHYQRYDQAGYGYRIPQPKLISKEEKNGGFEITLENRVEGAHLRYAIDGVPANVHSTVYTKPLHVENIHDFQAITVVNRRQFSLPLYFPKKYEGFEKYGELLAEWTPKDIRGITFGSFEMNATGKINKNAAYEITFIFTGGAYRLDIESVEVFKNGNKIAEDVHSGFTGSASQNNVYKFDIDEYETGAAFTIKARVRGDLGNDSHGAVFIKAK